MVRSLRVSPLRVAVLLALLIPATASVALASALTFTYDAGTDVLHDFDFDGYSFTLEFDHLHTSADITVTADTTVTETLPPGYQCIPIAESSCIQFAVTATAVGDPQTPITLTSPTDFDLYHVLIQWDFNTDPEFPDAPGGRVQILHFGEDGSVNDMTIPGTYFAPDEPAPAECGRDGLLHQLLSREDYENVCGVHHRHFPFFFHFHFPFFFPFDQPLWDPGVMGQDDSFSTFVVTEAPSVPEPATLVLLGAGLAAGVIARRRRP
jgi:hypothetical protein